jgi:hypothetical protein
MHPELAVTRLARIATPPILMSTSLATVTDWLDFRAPEVLAVSTPVVIKLLMNEEGAEIVMFPPAGGN